MRKTPRSMLVGSTRNEFRISSLASRPAHTENPCVIAQHAGSLFFAHRIEPCNSRESSLSARLRRTSTCEGNQQAYGRESAYQHQATKQAKSLKAKLMTRMLKATVKRPMGRLLLFTPERYSYPTGWGTALAPLPLKLLSLCDGLGVLSAEHLAPKTH